ncbi:MAG: AraC family transcriptional regulator [Eubacteriales bacterium]|nr:AraC family transcriptional regulator [Eubacteriales bacterium]
MQIITDNSQKELKEHGNYQFPLLVSEERLSKYESGSFLWHWHPEIELTLITSGEMIYKINNTSHHLRTGDALFGNANALHSGCRFQDKDCCYTSVTFDPRLIYGYENSLICSKYVEPVLQNFSLSSVHFDKTCEWHKESISLIEEMIRLRRTGKQGCELDLVVNLQKFWKLLYLHCAPLVPVTLNDKANYDRIRAILQYIEKNYKYRITLTDIAEEIHLCKSECSRLFKRYMKVSLFEYILEYRIQKSLPYLTDGSYTITEAAGKAGFNDPNYFTKVFIKIKGCSPSQYKKTLRQ